MIERALYLDLWKELSSEKQMIFISGPRQAGKTTLAKEIAKAFKNSTYFNWDITSNKKLLIEQPSFFEQINRLDGSMPLVILDEIHKYKHWKNYLKGVYDQFSGEYKFLVSGSGRLDLRQKTGDSLAGRYFAFHLFPFTLSELAEKRKTFKGFYKAPLENLDNIDRSSKEIWENLSTTGGFPEPFIKQKKAFWVKWSNNYGRQIIREDIRDLSGIKNAESAELLLSLLPSKVGSPVSINNIAGDLQVSFDTLKNWLTLFDSFYLTFRIAPWTKKISRAITKEKKLYLFNYPEIQDEAIRFENMIALELLRAVDTWNEHGYGRFGLHYIRNKEKEEVDFLISENNDPILLIEAKYSDDKPANSLVNFQDILHVPAIQLVNKENVLKYIKNKHQKILIITAHRWLASLP
ncbi:MAG: ATP-binding protein [Candidatus Omnitrophota bacterium]